MCDPTTLLALSIATSGVGLISQRQQARAQEEANNEAATRQMEEQQLVQNEKLSQRAREARAERARLRVVAGEAGVAGVSLGDQYSDIAYQEGRDSANIMKNTDLAMRQAQATNKSRNAAIQQPDYLGTALKVGAQYGNYKMSQKKT